MAWRTFVRASGVVVALGAAMNVACAQNLIKNGNFTDAGDPAASWQKEKADTGTLRAFRDTQTYVSPPASLCLQATGTGPAMGNCAQMVPITKPGNYRVRGMIKVSNAASGGVSLIPFAKGQQLGWNEVAFQTGTTDWGEFDLITRIPEGADSVLVLAFGELDRDGKLWVDDLSFEPVEDPKTRVTVVDLAGNVLRTANDSWVGHITGTSEGMKVSATGSGGTSLNRWIDLANKTNFVPVLYIKPLPGNTATMLELALADEKGAARVYRFKMPTNPNVMMPVLPENAATIGKPNEGPTGSVTLIKDVRLRSAGNPGDHLEVLIRGVELVAPGQTVSKMPPKAPINGTAAAAAPTPAPTPAPAPAPAPPTESKSAGPGNYGTPLLDLKTLGAQIKYGAWADRVQFLNGGLEVRNVPPAGGLAAGGGFDLSSKAAGIPAILVRTLPGNEAKTVTMLLKDAQGNGYFWGFALPPVGTQAYVRAENEKTLGTDKLDLSKVGEIHMQGNYGSSAPISIEVTRLDVIMPNQAPAAPALDLASRGRPQGVTSDPPIIQSVIAQSASCVVVEIASQAVGVTPPQKYSAGANDVLEEVENFPSLQKLTRDDHFIGYVDTASKVLYSVDVLKGAGLLPEEAQRTDLYQITSKDDRNYLKAVSPSAVELKACPADFALPSMSPAMRYVAYLQLAKPLTPERNYEVSMGSDIKPAKLRFSALRMRGEALHVAQAGFRLDDPLKMGRLSLWTGTGGKLPFVPKGFNVIEDSTGKSVIQGKLDLAKSDGVSGTDVYLMDFSSLKAPGKYRLYVPEMGVSEPFAVDASAWEDAFLISMRGFYAQRSGMEIGPPYVDFARKRTYHPLDGATVRLASFSLLQTNLAPGDKGDDYRILCAHDKGGAALLDVVGGYHESGASTVRRIQHLDATRMMLELYLMFPRYYSRLSINIPKAGRNNPDLLNEALWNIGLYQALQQPSGGVCGAVLDATPSIGYPVPPMTGNNLLATAPDVYSTYCYAATAARAALALKNADPNLSAKLEQSAIHAMEWAEKEVTGYTAPSDPIRAAIRDRRNLAAADLLRLTGNKAFNDVFAATTCLTQTPLMSYRIGDNGYDQREAVFIYARLPETMVDAALRKSAMDAVKNDADAALLLAQSNSWGFVAHVDSQLGMFASFPAMSLLHGHYVYKNDAYLKAAISHACFLTGGNPSNVSFVTGIGTRSVTDVVYPNTRVMRQPAPKGLTVFGPFAQSSSFADLEVVKQHVAETCTPKPADWPAAESYMDCYLINEECGFTIQQTLGPTTYLLGYLAAR